MNTEEKKGLTFHDAMEALNTGVKVKLPEWIGYWFKDGAKIMVFTQTGDILDTPEIESYNNRNDWQITDGNLGFDFAILAIKAGKLVTRKGWNGKGMFVFKRPADELPLEMVVNTVKSLPEAVKAYYRPFLEGLVKDDQGAEYAANFKIKFSSYMCMRAADGTIVNGWLASQSDLLAKDWEVFSAV